MLSKEILDYLSNLIGSKINKIQTVSGGDISSAYLIKTSSEKYFLKVNEEPWASDMFKAEAFGLTAIANTNTIATPKVIECNKIKNHSFILMEYVEALRASSKDLELLGNQLAQLHQVTSDQFGFEDNNFIGSLNQSNRKHKTWNDFYIQERLITQLQLARSKGLLKDSEIPETQKMKDIFLPIFEGIKPSLLHGDLWSGNYLISSANKPYLIDPAAYFGHSEVDIAMSKMFGGFGSSFYEAYHDTISKDAYSETRIKLYQLYYLLVHLNLFGPSYYSSVKRILRILL